MEFYDDELEVSNGLDSDIENTQLLTEIKLLKKMRVVIIFYLRVVR